MTTSIDDQPPDTTRVRGKIQTEESHERSLVISYLTLRKLIGILGFSFPAILVGGVLILGGDEIQSSISYYYHTSMRDVFVGVLCAIAVFLFSYKGYDRVDDVVGNLGCLFALGVAFLPTTREEPPSDASPVAGYLHLTFAALFFLTLIYFSLFLFTKTGGPGTPSKQKQRRNRVYRVCGYTMLGCIVLIAVYFTILREKLQNLEYLNLVFWLESVAVMAFGVSWLTKGQAILKDINRQE